MHYIRPLLVLVIVVIAAVIQIDGASASSTFTTEATKEAYATFQSQSGVLRTYVEINVAEGETTSSEGSERGLHADIEILQVDDRGGRNRMIDVAGSVETDAGAFKLDDGLSAASLDITIPVCGARPGHDARLKQRPFHDCFDVQVSLQWAGSGDLTSHSGTDDHPLDVCTVHTLSDYQRRTASSAGVVLVRGTNLAVGQSIAAAMGAYSQETTVSCPD